MKILCDENIPFAADCFSHIGDVAVCPAKDITPEAVADADILLVRSVTKVTADLLAESNVRFVGTATSGFEHIDLAYLKKRGIAFAFAPACNAESVAEYVVAAVLELAERYEIRLKDKSIGIVGAGNIGSKVAEKAATVGMNVLLNDPPLARQTSEAKYLPLERLYGCDFITLHVPLTFDGPDKTHHLADERFFQSFKKGVFFINTARGAVADTSALKDAIKCGIVKASVIDVWENEPDIDVELVEMADIATAHIAGYSFDGKVAGTIMIYRALCDFLGVKAKHTAADFLRPDGEGSVITITQSDSQQIFCRAIRQVYDILKDDADLKAVLKVAHSRRGEYFEKLRRDYPVRREFGNTVVSVGGGDKAVIDSLKRLGFGVSG